MQVDEYRPNSLQQQQQQQAHSGDENPLLDDEDEQEALFDCFDRMEDLPEAALAERQYRYHRRQQRVKVASQAIREADLQRIFVECSADPNRVIQATDEQRKLLRYRPRLRQRVVVQAVAGAGKTTLCKMLVRRLAPLKVLYLAYNRMAAAEAKRDMPSTVDARTIHSLALKYVRGAAKDLNNLPSTPESLGDPQAVRSFEKFCRDPRTSLPDHYEAAEAWRDMLAGRKPYTYDALLKKMTLDGEKSRQWLSLEYDVVIVDEAQDSQPAFLDWFERIGDMLLYAVGDRFQSIYSFNGTVNAMQSLRDDPFEKRTPGDDAEHLCERDGQPNLYGDYDDDEDAALFGEDNFIDDDADDEEDEEEDEDEDEAVFEDEDEQREADVAAFGLTKSFRFGANLGRFASNILRQASLYPDGVSLQTSIVTGSAPGTTRVERMHNLISSFGDGQGPIYCLARRNATLIKHALQYQAQRPDARVAFFGNASHIVSQLREVMAQSPEWRRKEHQRLRAKSGAHHSDPVAVPDLLDWEKHRAAALRSIEKTPDAVVRALLDKTIFEDDDDDDETQQDDNDEEDDMDECASNDDDDQWEDKEAEWYLSVEADVHYGTVHSSKGLEFDRVAVLHDMVPLKLACDWLTATKNDPNANDRSRMPPQLRNSVGYPQYGVTARDQVREEVHLAYVAITRAKKVLYLDDHYYQFACASIDADLSTGKITN